MPCQRCEERGETCRTCANYERYGACVNGCAGPAVSRRGWCSACYKRGGNAPTKRHRRNKDQTCSQCDRRAYCLGRCVHCWRLEKYGQCLYCVSPAVGKKGLCSRCLRRGGPPHKPAGALVNDSYQRWCSCCSRLKTTRDFYSGGDRLARWCKECVKEGARRRGRNARDKIMAFQKEICYQTANDLCVKCWKPYGTSWHVDHIRPSSHGGQDDWNNLQIMCATCNLSKGNRESIDWRLMLLPVAED